MELKLKMVKFKQKRKGFTLVELIVVIAIIGILAGVMLPRYFGFTDSARKGVAISEAKSIRALAETYYAKEGSWPNTLANGASGFKVGSDTSTTFSGNIYLFGKSKPLDDGVFIYIKDKQGAVCNENGDVREATEAEIKSVTPESGEET